LAGLDHEAEVAARLHAPALDHARLRRAVEGVVDLDRRQARRVEGEALLRRQLLGVEHALPLVVAEAAGARVEPHAGIVRVARGARAKRLAAGFARARARQSSPREGTMMLRTRLFRPRLFAVACLALTAACQGPHVCDASCEAGQVAVAADTEPA